ncbi:MAG: ABC transporter ATP-binding protein [Phycisphaerales bacterium]
MEPVTRAISFAIHAGQTLALVGESGSGKSATALMIPRLIDAARISRGRVVLGGRRLDNLSEDELRRVRGREIGVVFQEPMSSLNPVMTIGDQVMEALRTHERMDGREARSRVVAALARVGIERPEDCFSLYPHQFSGGMRQRAMIAMALICGPGLLIADEPTTALDASVQAKVLDLIRSLRDERGMGVLLVSHDVGVVAGHADAVCVMCAGRVLEFGPVRDVLSNPLHPYTRGLLASAPRADVRVARLSTVADVISDPALASRFSDATGGLRHYWPGTGREGESWAMAELPGWRWAAVWSRGPESPCLPACPPESRLAARESR